jgi:hypothetical protein
MSPRRVGVIRAAAATAAVALVGALGVVMSDRPGSYYGRVNVVLVPPGATNPTASDNPLERRIQTTIDFAGIVAKEVGNLSATKVDVSSQVTLQDENIQHGWSVRQPAGGSQWDLLFDQPVVEVQATGTSLPEVTARIDQVVARIKAAAVERQEAAGVEPTSQVQFILSPSIPIVTYAEGSRKRTVVALAIVGVLAGWAGSGLAGWLVRARTARPRRPRSFRSARSKREGHDPVGVATVEREVAKT